MSYKYTRFFTRGIVEWYLGLDSQSNSYDALVTPGNLSLTNTSTVGLAASSGSPVFLGPGSLSLGGKRSVRIVTILIVVVNFLHQVSPQKQPRLMRMVPSTTQILVLVWMAIHVMVPRQVGHTKTVPTFGVPHCFCLTMKLNVFFASVFFGSFSTQRSIYKHHGSVQNGCD